jgi:hypothetical protein
MTPPPDAPDPAATPRWLRELHPEGGPYDLTFEGYQQAIQGVRDNDATRARRIEREAGPYFESRVFPRRRIPWTSTSQGLRARLHLLPQNPHLELDAGQLRAALGLDPAWFARGPADEEGLGQLGLLRPETPEGEQRVIGGHRASTWLAIHSGFPGAHEVDDDPFALPDEARRNAVATGSAATTGVPAPLPQWAHLAPDAPDPPLHQLAQQLLRRHHLPAVRSLELALLFHLLTGARSYLENRTLPAVIIELSASGVAAGYDSFTVALAGLDEFISTADWQTIWRRYIRPRQEMYLEQRGAFPRGRFGVDLRRLIWKSLSSGARAGSAAEVRKQRRSSP